MHRNPPKTVKSVFVLKAQIVRPMVIPAVIITAINTVEGSAQAVHPLTKYDKDILKKKRRMQFLGYSLLALLLHIRVSIVTRQTMKQIICSHTCEHTKYLYEGDVSDGTHIKLVTTNSIDKIPQTLRTKPTLSDWWSRTLQLY